MRRKRIGTGEMARQKRLRSQKVEHLVKKGLHDLDGSGDAWEAAVCDGHPFASDERRRGGFEAESLAASPQKTGPVIDRP